jgi:glycosyltransferase involved in cell wall biosynthesis
MHVTSASSNPLVSIVTVTLNSAATVERTIRSVLGQTYAPIEYIIIDGGSTDGTLAIIDKYAAHIAYRVSEADNGIYHAMNKGIAVATGQIVGIINSDDWLEEDALAAVVKAAASLEEEPCVIHGKLALFDRAGTYVGDRAPRRLPFYALFSTPFKHPATFVSRKLYDRIGRFDESIGLSADYDLMLRIVRSGCPSVFVDKVLTNVQLVGVSTSGLRSGPFKNRVEIVSRHVGSPAVAMGVCILRSVYKSLRKAGVSMLGRSRAFGLMNRKRAKSAGL